MKQALLMLLFVIQSVGSFSATKPYGLQQAQEQLKEKFTNDSKYPKVIIPETMGYYVIKMAYDNADKKWYRSYPTKEDKFRLVTKVKANTYYTLCEQTKDTDACESLKQELKFINDLSKTSPMYKDFKPKIIDLPKIDIAAKTFTVASGETYSFETGELISKVNKPTQTISQQIAAPVASTGPMGPAAQLEPSVKSNRGQQQSAEYTDEKPDNDDSEYKCEWSKTLPRKIVRGSGCSSNGARICTGYVTCGTSARKADRLATCGESLCGEGQATSCSRQPGYGSKSAGEADSSFTNSKRAVSAGEVTQ